MPLYLGVEVSKAEFQVMKTPGILLVEGKVMEMEC